MRRSIPVAVSLFAMFGCTTPGSSNTQVGEEVPGHSVTSGTQVDEEAPDRSVTAGPAPGPTTFIFPDGTEGKGSAEYSETSYRDDVDGPCQDFDLRANTWTSWSVPDSAVGADVELTANGFMGGFLFDVRIADGAPRFFSCRDRITESLMIPTDDGLLMLDVTSFVFRDVEFDVRAGEVRFTLQIEAVSRHRFAADEPIETSSWRHLDGTLEFEIRGMALIERWAQ